MKQEYDFSHSERGKFFRADLQSRFPTSGGQPDWVGSEGSLAKFVVEEAEKTLGAYRAQPKLITRDANEEHDTAHGVYAERQLFELVQNSADALREAPMGKSILIRLTEGFLYCADNGNPIDERGIDGLMFARMSSKRNTGAIGRFGLGFKSVLRVTDSPEFYSRPGSFRFDGARSAERIAGIAPAEFAERYPVLHLPEPIDPLAERDRDEELHELMSWATNIVRLPLKPGTYGDLDEQIANFPPEFLLLVDHVRYLTLEKAEAAREFVLEERRGELRLETGEGVSRWRRFETTHRLSPKARSDWPLHDDSGEVPIRWVAPLDRLDRPGHFWAFFPTRTASPVAGILNAPWKTNADLQNLLPGPYNDELIEAAAGMIAENLHILATPDDPARHLDALPRRKESGDTEQSVLLRDRLSTCIREREIVPDQDGELRLIGEVSYPPKTLTDGADRAPLERWAGYSGRPSNWLHHSALTRNRLPSIDRLFPPSGYGIDGRAHAAPRATIAKWLEALVEGRQADDAVQASMAAIRTAAAIPPETRSKERLGEIVLTASGGWRLPDPGRLVLPDGSPNGAVSEPDWCVHAELASDRDTRTALEALGLKPAQRRPSSDT